MGQEMPQNCPFPRGIWSPTQCVVPCTQLSPHPEPHLDWFSHSDTTYRRRPCHTCNSRLYLYTACMQCSIIMITSVQSILAKGCIAITHPPLCSHYSLTLPTQVPAQVALSVGGGIRTPLNTQFLGPRTVCPQMAYQSVWPLYMGHVCAQHK